MIECLGGNFRWQGDGFAAGVDLVGFDAEVGEVGDAEAGGDGDVGGVAAGGHEDTAEAGMVVAGVHVPPFAVDEDLVPGAEVAGAGVGDADVADVTCDVAGGDVHGASEGDGEVLVVAADADALGEDVEGGFGGAGGLVVEGDFVVDPVTDGGGESEAGAHVAEEVVGDAVEAIDLAVAAGEEELEGLGGKVFDEGLGCVEGLRFGLVVGVDGVGAGEAQGAGGSDEAGAAVAEAIEVVGDGEGGADAGFEVIDGDVVGCGELGVDAWVEVEKRDHGRGLREVELDVELGCDEQRWPFETVFTRLPRAGFGEATRLDAANGAWGCSECTLCDGLERRGTGTTEKKEHEAEESAGEDAEGGVGEEGAGDAVVGVGAAVDDLHVNDGDERGSVEEAVLGGGEGVVATDGLEGDGGDAGVREGLEDVFADHGEAEGGGRVVEQEKCRCKDCSSDADTKIERAQREELGEGCKDEAAEDAGE